ncbi:ABC transporter ATP-binding protein [Nakamurella aerolata]|uniref:ABC transporter ATP-binding protein n=1 Tax=Nakamurella aerolata TaxID=1656892 RepID=A0A849A7I9_9ACTN|nr:ABC transporter ATP-binding protein [Nakamurella aerolata]NNG36455.1 ABC transporter ATP-binding protein [Nakamurella aerolata]
MRAGEPAALRLDGIEVTCEGRQLLRQVGLSVGRGEVVGLLGPNGAGKSTLLRVLYRSLRPGAGSVRLTGDPAATEPATDPATTDPATTDGATADGQRSADLLRLPLRRVAALRAIVPQLPEHPASMTVLETVATGRISMGSRFGGRAGADAEAAAATLRRVGLDWAVDRQVGSLSGGERQKVFIARALCQGAPFLILDEPTNHLDVRSALEVMELLSELDVGVLAALHDLDHAAAYCDRVVVLAYGAVVAQGAPAQVLSDALIRRVFGVRAQLPPHPLTGRLAVQLAPVARDSGPDQPAGDDPAKAPTATVGTATADTATSDTVPSHPATSHPVPSHPATSHPARTATATRMSV